MKSGIVLTILVVVLCEENQGHVEMNSMKPHHRHHKTSQARLASWQEEKEALESLDHRQKPPSQDNAGEIRGIYFVVSLDESPPKKVRNKRQASIEVGAEPQEGGGAPGPPTITTLEIQSDINNRFSTTKMKSVISNVDEEDKEANFVVQLPEKAFISNFSMLINERLYIGEVKEKEQAEKEYEEAKKRKETAGKVSSVPRTVDNPTRGMEVFSVLVNVAKKSSVEFVLTYQQLLERKLGVYTQVTSVRPNQIVKDLKITVNIAEIQAIKFAHVSIDGAPLAEATVQSVDEMTRKITYSPNEQTQIEMDPKKGFNGNVKIMYDVAHAAQDAGMVCVDGDYFIHYFSPTGLDPLSKNVVFVIDVSGSMGGTKIEQTHKAMFAILDILRSGDRFQFILFSTTLSFWPESRELIPAYLENINRAKEFLDSGLVAKGSTNINEALVEACRSLNNNPQWGSNIIVFLTDGQPTAGVTNADRIVQNVVTEASGKVSVFSLGFGNKYELDFDLLKRISYRTGVTEGAIRIYPGLEAEEQLKQFFALVNTPLLYDVKIQYPVDIVLVDAVTQKDFAQYFNGSELVVAGKLNPNRIDKQMSIRVGAVSTLQVKFEKEVDLDSSCPVITKGYAQKLYAYMMIKYLLIQVEKTDNSATQQQIKQDALKLALDYNLVTPLTSMVITQRASEPGSFYAEENSFVETKAVFSSTSGYAVMKLTLFSTSRIIFMAMVSLTAVTYLV